jgi:hypothetical protein
MGRRVTGGLFHFSTFKKASFSRDSRRVNGFIIRKMAVYRHFFRI